MIGAALQAHRPARVMLRGGLRRKQSPGLRSVALGKKATGQRVTPSWKQIQDAPHDIEKVGNPDQDPGVEGRDVAKMRGVVKKRGVATGMWPMKESMSMRKEVAMEGGRGQGGGGGPS